MGLDTERHDKLAVYEKLFGKFEDLEWSSTRRGPGSGPMGSGGDGHPYPACPACGGLKEPNGVFREEAIGHQPGCYLAAALGKPTRALREGEQGEIPL